MARLAQEAFNHLVTDLRTTHGDNLLAAVLYGPAAVTGDTSEGHYNLLIVLKQVTPRDLQAAQAPVREWQRLGHPLPVYLTQDELATAADVFPIEFYTMGRARVVLHGDDPLVNVKVDAVNLRHQTEYELRSKLMQLRRRAIPVTAAAPRLTLLMTESLQTFAKLFIPVLLLHGESEPPVTPRQTTEALVRVLGLDGETFNRIFDLRQTRTELAAEIEANDLFARYLTQLERVIEAVDQLSLTADSK